LYKIRFYTKIKLEKKKRLKRYQFVNWRTKVNFYINFEHTNDFLLHFTLIILLSIFFNLFSDQQIRSNWLSILKLKDSIGKKRFKNKKIYIVNDILHWCKPPFYFSFFFILNHGWAITGSFRYLSHDPMFEWCGAIQHIHTHT